MKDNKMEVVLNHHKLLRHYIGITIIILYILSLILLIGLLAIFNTPLIRNTIVPILIATNLFLMLSFIIFNVIQEMVLNKVKVLNKK